VSLVAIVLVVWLLLLGAVAAALVVRTPGLRPQAAGFARALLPVLAVPLLLVGSHALQRADAVRRHSLDLTGNERNTFTPQTGDVLDDLGPVRADVVITGFFPADQSRWRSVARTLRRYDESSERVKTRFVNPEQRPALAREYGIVDVGDVFIEVDAPGDAEVRRVRAESSSETDLTTALVRVLNGDRTVCWSGGHGERPPSDPTLQSAVARLSANGFEVREGRLTQGPGFLAGCSILIVASPRAAPLPEEAELFDAFLVAGGRSLVLLDPDDAGDDVADAWGAIAAVEALPGEVDDPESSVEREPGAIAADRFPSSSPITEKLPAAFFLGVRGLALPPDDPGRGLTASELVTASEEATAGGRKAPALGVALDISRVVGDGTSSQVIRTRMAAFGDADWLQNEAIGLLGNEQLWIRTLNWLAESPTLVAIPSRLAADEVLVLTASDRRRVDVGVFVIPTLIVVVAGAARYLLSGRRRSPGAG
jgi:hypothetical protein